MSQKRRSPRENGPGQFPSMTSPTQGAISECTEISSETSGNERENDDYSLTFRQRAVLTTVAISRSVAQAARDSGIAESTLRRWLADPSFRRELTRVRQEYQVLNRQQALAAVPIGMSVVVALATGATDEALRFRAARFLVEHGDKQGDIDGLSDELQELRDAIQSSDNTNALD